MTPSVATAPPAAPPTRLALRRAYRRLLRVTAAELWAGALIAPAPLVLLTGHAAVGLLAVVLGVAAVTDLLWRRVFNWLLGAALVWVVTLQVVAPGQFGLPSPAMSAVGLAACFGAMLGLYLCFHGGEGDVKLLAVVGAVLGPWGGLEVLLGGYLLAAAAALVWVAARGVRRFAGGAPAPFLAGTLPMAPFFATAALFVRM